MTPPLPPAQSARGTILLGLGAILSLVLVLVVWGLLARIDGAVIVSGQIEVERNRQIIQHPEGGVVQALFIREGDRVAAGALLLRLGDDQIAPELATVTTRRDEALAQKARLEAERDGADVPVFAAELVQRRAEDPALEELLAGQESLFAARLASVQRRKAQLLLQSQQVGAEGTALAKQAESLERLASLTLAELARQEGLTGKGLVPQQQLTALRRDLTQIDSSRAELLAARSQAVQRQAEVALLIEQALAERRDQALAELRELEPVLAGLSEQRQALLRRHQALEIRAPIAGRVFGLQVFAAQTVIRPAEPLLFLIPEDRDLVIAALVPALAIDRVHQGQSVTLSFPGLDGGGAPKLLARVQSLSGDAFADERQGPVYRAELKLLPGEAARLSAGQSLLPGMPVEAFLLTGARPPLAYLTGPLGSYFNRALRGG